MEGKSRITEVQQAQPEDKLLILKVVRKNKISSKATPSTFPSRNLPMTWSLRKLILSKAYTSKKPKSKISTRIFHFKSGLSVF